MPSQAKPLWVLTLLMLFAGPAANMIYWERVLMSGVLPPDGDAIAIPIFEGILGALIITPFVLGVTWFCLRRYNPQTRFLAWRSDRKLRSLFSSLLFGSAACFVARDVINIFLGHYSSYEYIMLPFLALCIGWLFAMRAALIEQL
jgi:hypothetical protein